MKNTLLALALLAAVAGPAHADSDGVRVEAHAQASGYRLVARGRPGQADERLLAAMKVEAGRLCAGGTLTEPAASGSYEYLNGGNQFLMPAGRVLMPMASYHQLEVAPLLSSMLACPAEPGSPKNEAALRLRIDSELPEHVNYIDLGFGSSIRARLEVPLSGKRYADLVAEAAAEALRARGYALALEPAGQAVAGAAQLRVAGAEVAYENFYGMAMVTKIGLLGLSNQSAAFCSISLNLALGGTPLSAGMVSTREMLPAIYSDWGRDMAQGPAPAVHQSSTERLGKTLQANVRAAVHAMPSAALQSWLELAASSSP
ncbi:hypothetical protein RQP53_23530 [Paucibacter sp. APW11]|uniref:Uncharacterized protein n=1 Tax=Roseateles aquae TaxID=3077235 RepID=A0ABU3PJE2_9BURK|nr:hypothetical protein [Paucibacter sp. APW11]MDT9002272.1 hypothetical protein [Paucibacter sp. APW11]